MDRPFDLLYNNSMENFNELLRLLDGDELHAYHECGRCLTRQGLALGIRLSALASL